MFTVIIMKSVNKMLLKKVTQKYLYQELKMPTLPTFIIHLEIMHMHVHCNYHEIREQDATEKSYPKISVPRTKDAEFAYFYHGWYRSVSISNVLQKDDFFNFPLLLTGA